MVQAIVLVDIEPTMPRTSYLLMPLNRPGILAVRPAIWPTAVSVIRTGFWVNLRTILIVLPKIVWNVSRDLS